MRDRKRARVDALRLEVEDARRIYTDKGRELTAEVNALSRLDAALGEEVGSSVREPSDELEPGEVVP